MVMLLWLVFALWPERCCLHRYPVGGELKYASEAQELIRPERNTLLVSFEDIERYNQQLSTTILEEYYRYFCRYVVCRISCAFFGEKV